MGLVIKELRKNLTIRIKTYGAGDKRVAQKPCHKNKDLWGW
jgi:hypothetical protein